MKRKGRKKSTDRGKKAAKLRNAKTAKLARGENLVDAVKLFENGISRNHSHPRPVSAVDIAYVLMYVMY